MPVARTGVLIGQPVAKVFGAFVDPSITTRFWLTKSSGRGGRTTVEWKFASQTNNATFVSITESGWTGTGDELVEYATTATHGFTWTLAGLKTLLEHNVRLNLVADRFPRGPGEPYCDE